MIFLTCGVPGAGKTLWTIEAVEARRVAEKREVYYFGIVGLTLPWHELQSGVDWDAVPDGSIVVVDECQKLFPVRKQGTPVPEPVRRMETHRHRGLDLYLVSQNPLQVDTAVRHLVGEYRFLNRPFGHDYAVVWKFGHVCEWKNATEQAGAVKARWKFPPQVFGWYKSAEQHTHKKSIPPMFWMVPVGVLVVGLLGYGITRVVSHFRGDSKVAQVEVKTGGVITSAAALVTDRRAYLEQRTARVAFIPESAPIYDQIAVPVTFPRLSACIVGAKSVCRCYTQQGTQIPVPDLQCVQFVKVGAFDPYRGPDVPAAVGGGPPARAEGGAVATGGSGPHKPPSLGLGEKVGDAVPAKPVSETPRGGERLLQPVHASGFATPSP